MKCWKVLGVALCCTLLMLAPGVLQAQQDPGPRAGAAGAGGPYPTLVGPELDLFTQALDRFQEVDSVSGNIPGEDDAGLGPTFNGNSCAMCHAQPFVGGTSPGLTSPQNPVPNPQVALAKLHNAANTVPSFITTEGSVREVRFVRNRDGSPDGGVHDLFTITGRDDAPASCTLAQPDFAGQLAANNVIFRIPTPTFGLGLVENTPDDALRANLASTRDARRRMGIGGSFNTSGNDGTITRFGWKAQNKSLLIFAGEAYNVEQGVTNELFPNERSGVFGCVINPLPEDASGGSDSPLSDTSLFAAFMRLSAPPAPAAPTASTQKGATLFSAVGCALCHSPSLTTGSSRFTGMSGVTYQPYSDFALHHMGSDLADGVSQGAAGPDEFRTAPLWGVGQRLFFLHDGRTSDLLQAIEEHSDCGGKTFGGHGFNHDRFNNCSSEANQVIRNFNGLSQSQQQDILNFLRSL
ncbi:MAG TPA: di-heme oxidoredictase family protein [Terriglobales bacterium]|nr:di-heme oxidoredictase family protein [Terriglobales bacterium]